MPSAAALRLLRNVAFAGAVGELSEIVGVDGDRPALLAELAAEGLVDVEGLIAPTERGLALLDAGYAAERALIPGAARDALHREFKPLDRRIKELARAWQDADARDDWDARMAAIEGLVALHGEHGAWLERHHGALARFDEYRERLSRALERVLDGDTDFFVKVQVDSYHTAWFQMHEDLLRLLQQERDPE